jgi:hypothetical protein
MQIKIPNFPKKTVILNFLRSVGLSNSILSLKDDKVLAPKIEKLFFLYKIIILNKRLTALEFGSGWSTSILSLALGENSKKFNGKNVPTKKNKFELFSLDQSKKYLNISKKRLKKIKNTKSKINWMYSPVKMSEFESRICTVYTKLPLCNPDFIYLDGPGIFEIKNKINNFSSAHDDLVPMSCDILKIEFYLIPGTIVLVDGRKANVEFLKKNFKRNWVYKYIKKIDQHLFFLNEKPWGKRNLRLLKFYR